MAGSQAAAAPKPQEQAADPIYEGTVGTAIRNAQIMLKAKRDLQADLQGARDWLGQSVKLKVCNPQQVAWIEKNLPKRTRGEGHV